MRYPSTTDPCRLINANEMVGLARCCVTDLDPGAAAITPQNLAEGLHTDLRHLLRAQWTVRGNTETTGRCCWSPFPRSRVGRLARLPTIIPSLAIMRI